MKISYRESYPEKTAYRELPIEKTTYREFENLKITYRENMSKLVIKYGRQLHPLYLYVKVTSKNEVWDFFSVLHRQQQTFISRIF